VEVTTVARGAIPSGTRALRTERDSAGMGLVVRGRIAAGDSASVTFTYADPADAYLRAMAWALTTRGVAVEERPAPFAVADGNGGGQHDGDTLLVTHSPPLREVLAAFEKPSQNQIGELLLKTLGLERAGVGSADSGAAVVRRQLLAWGALPDGFIVRDGSGLSRHNVITPETIVKVLDAMRTSPHFRAFHDALPIAGVDGTIANRMKGTPAAGNVHAKTGTLDLARSLSGYVTTADGRLLLFSMLANNWTTPVREVEIVQDTILARVAGMRLAR
jgi:D-alanyl-D-alanine carboxypeptidase/D-alanyl-D-alanine-endopeptidase (penicillin-binding protein 4)